MKHPHHLRDLGIRTKVLLTPVLLTVSLAVVSGLTLSSLRRQHLLFDQVHEVAHSRLPLVYSFLNCGETLRSDVLDLYATHGMQSPIADRTGAQSRIDLGLAELQVLYGETLTTWTLDEEERGQLERMRPLLTELRRRVHQAARALDSDPALAVLFVRSARETFNQLRGLQEQFLELQEAAVSQAQARAVRLESATRRNTLLAVLLVAAASVLVTVLIGRSIAGPVLRLTGTVRELAAGKLESVVADQQRGDEVGEMARAVEVFRRMALERELFQGHLRHHQKLEAIGTLASGVAHEINNPINGIMNYAQLIKDMLNGQNETVDEFTDEIVHETERIATIVRNLLAFAQQDSHDAPSMARVTDIVQGTLALIQAVMRRDQITVEVDLPDDLPEVRCHSQQIQQVVMNLLTNARDALNAKYKGYHEDKIIIVSAREMALVNGHRSLAEDGLPNDQCPMTNDVRDSEPMTNDAGDSQPLTNDATQASRLIRLTVEDHGAGISEEALERIFEPFYTTKNRARTGDQPRGTGLGLAISHGIIEDHGGALTVESEEGVFTRFSVNLPIEDDNLDGSENVRVRQP